MYYLQAEIKVIQSSVERDDFHSSILKITFYFILFLFLIGV